MDTLAELKEYLQQHPEVVDSINTAKTEEEVNAILKQIGCNLTLADIKELEQEQNIELSEDELDSVAGGYSRGNESDFKDALKECTAYGIKTDEWDGQTGWVSYF